MSERKVRTMEEAVEFLVSERWRIHRDSGGTTPPTCVYLRASDGSGGTLHVLPYDDATPEGTYPLRWRRSGDRMPWHLTDEQWRDDARETLRREPILAVDTVRP